MYVEWLTTLFVFSLVHVCNTVCAAGHTILKRARRSFCDFLLCLNYLKITVLNTAVNKMILI